MSEKLLPCPFCGSEPAVTQAKKYRVVECVNNECPIHQWGIIEAEWDRRTSPPATTDLRDWIAGWSTLAIFDDNTRAKFEAFLAEWPNSLSADSSPRTG